jgi:VWFA-related protein
VEVEVVVRDKNGPVSGLTRDEFTLLDQGKPQPIAVFNGGVAGQPGVVQARLSAPLPPGAVSNRMGRPGHSTSGATVLLLDQLNTSIDNQGYSRGQLLKYLESVSGDEQIAIYLLGRSLSVVQDFTDNPETLREAVRKFDPKTLYVAIWNTENMDATDREMYGDNPVYRAIRNRITTEAVAKITQHLSGMPGRKSLVWLSDTPGDPGGQFLRAANIHLYPVLVRGVGGSGVFAWLRDIKEMGPIGAMAPPHMPIGNDLARQHANAAVGAAGGGVGFMDSRDISTAVHTAVEDADTAYVLGFYPAEETLDNKFHVLTVNVGKKGAARGRILEVRYRPGYVATRAGLGAPAPASIEDVLRNPLNVTTIGITAAPGFTDGKYQVTVTVDLHDIHFEMQNNRHAATLALSIADDSSVQTETLKLSYTDAELATALERGLILSKTLEQKSAVRIVARDAATGAVGSLWVPPSEK